MTATYEYRCRHCGTIREIRRATGERNHAAFCTTCDVWSGRRIPSVPVLRGETVAKS